MRRKIKIIILILLISNIFLVGYTVYSKKDGIYLKLSKVFSRETIVTQEQLSKMNKTKIPLFFDTNNNKEGKPFKILVIGNSITYMGIQKQIGWLQENGVAASKIENDYAHLIFKKTEGLLHNRNISMRISNLVEFEINYATFDFSVIDSLIGYHPDLIIFQLGENVSFDKIKTPVLFKQRYIDLVNCFVSVQKPTVICTIPFIKSEGKSEIIQQVALSTKSFLVDLSNLVLRDDENYAKYERNYKGDKSLWKVSGLGIHPGDLGMRNIAEKIFIVINASFE